MKIDFSRINPFNKTTEVKPATIQDFSATTRVLAKGREWTEQSSKAGFSVQGVTKFAGAHLVIPVGLVAAAALDALVHLLAAAAKTVAMPFRAVLFAVSLGRWNEPKSANPSEVAKHLAKVVGSVAAVVVNAPVSALSVQSAINFSNAIGLTNIVGEKAPRTWKQLGKDCVSATVDLGRKVFVDLPKAAFRKAVDHPKTTGAVVLVAGAIGAHRASCSFGSYCLDDKVKEAGDAVHKFVCTNVPFAGKVLACA